ncbi:TlpA family protein disulfide reductase [Chryseobacterium sp. Tr-659]|uniref:TlpA family protein disulfide reductase n=1 Tax=Chryseobacterium sp. Tr-659 TaxID=2608340 RepID=UPI00141ED07D|nr:TlpA disulfide reductase family protein [Chryseobacterium sp. Tr-659]NIF06374.1 TlpA family protein disulfide reductase [Chryseobacterium sp. Tr-659]
MNRIFFKKGLIFGLILGAILSFSFLGYLYYVTKKNLQQNEKVTKSKSFKDLNLKLEYLDGKPFNIAQFPNKKVLINIWGTWCAPCRKEMPLLQDTYNLVKNDYVFIMISDEKPEVIKAFNDKEGYNFIFVRSTENLKSKIGAFPTTFILDQSQNIQYTKTGSFDDMNENELKALLLK